MNKNENYKELFEFYSKKIRLIDKKATFFISVNTLFIAAVAIFNEKLQTWSLVTILVLLSTSAILFILSTFPILWNKYEKNKNNPIHLPTLWKIKNIDEFKKFIDREIDNANYLTQLKRIIEICKKKYIMLMCAISILLVSIITFVVIVLVTFLS